LILGLYSPFFCSITPSDIPKTQGGDSSESLFPLSNNALFVRGINYVNGKVRSAPALLDSIKKTVGNPSALWNYAGGRIKRISPTYIFKAIGAAVAIYLSSVYAPVWSNFILKNFLNTLYALGPLITTEAAYYLLYDTIFNLSPSITGDEKKQTEYINFLLMVLSLARVLLPCVGILKGDRLHAGMYLAGFYHMVDEKNQEMTSEKKKSR
jgi:hypothetical protein